MRIRMIQLVIASLGCSSVFAQPVPIYGNTYDATAPAQYAGVAAYGQSTDIRRQIATDPDLLRVNPAVYVDGGIVRYVGRFTNINQAIKLVQIAMSLKGVTDVDVTALVDQNGNPPPPALLIQAKIKGLYVQKQIFGNVTLDSLPVSVETVSVVSLVGTVATQEQADAAISIAKSVSGVGRVDAKIDVQK